ncbi:hypothetical protein SNOG_05706 [Paecilomyces variotii No. 5]|uniref:Enoyl reductase (ER) domain-containing protein n=1 Tax=Byssochlamys spectabilis (strain No. 5 / NBRC 109023) TaxID=1356009 RepID=V5I1L3_BYSSN|nr:hypothetical protein SNOG_05706 [Paecilomyces variotii No. 5]
MATSNLPETMKAQVLEEFNSPYVLREVPLPKISSPHDILIKVDAASYCHTDAVLAAGDMPPNPRSLPHVGSHEFAGTVIETASGGSADFKPGDRVGAPGRALHACGVCDECQDEKHPENDAAGYSVFCPASESNGVTVDGGFREYAVVDARQVVPIPPELSAADTAPMMCAGVTIYAALKRCGLERGQRVGIVGCGGGLGHLGLQFGVKMGLQVFGIDNADTSLELARGLNTGARIVDSRIEEAAEVVRQIGITDKKKYPGEMGLDAAIILPESQKAFDYGMALLKNHGRLVLVSFPKDGFHISSRDIVFRDISIVGSLVGGRKTMKETLEFSAKHNIRPIIKKYPLSKLNELVGDYNRGTGGKLIVDMSLEG